MLELTQFVTKTKKEDLIYGEYEGNEKTGKAIVFSHGFGSDRTGRGKFIEVGNLMKERFLVVRFDYYKFQNNKKERYLYPYSKLAEIFEEVIFFVNKKFNASEINVIAQSMGCLIVGMTKRAKLNKVMLSVTPVTSPYSVFKEHYSKRNKTAIDEDGLSKIVSSDGSITYIDADFWVEMKSVNPVNLYKKLAKRTKLYFIKARQDQIVTEDLKVKMNKFKNAKYFELDGDHSFSGQARKEWTSLVKMLLN